MPAWVEVVCLWAGALAWMPLSGKANGVFYAGQGRRIGHTTHCTSPFTPKSWLQAGKWHEQCLQHAEELRLALAAAAREVAHLQQQAQLVASEAAGPLGLGLAAACNEAENWKTSTLARRVSLSSLSIHAFLQPPVALHLCTCRSLTYSGSISVAV